ncbi:DcrB-related protein [Pseudomonas viridiflava]|uniref:DcrB-related protein n=1 Tax=Pseudomonas viridiflava TaxID=33069 RepID=UPI000F011ABE|nr:DcrB-related protein [Pseudomonas viridiflava]
MRQRTDGRTSFYDRLSENRIREEQRLEAERLAQEALDAIPIPERFQTNELSFIRPAGFKDKTFHVFTLTDIEPSPSSVVIGRTPVEGDADLETMSQMLFGDLKKALSHLEWVEALCPAEVAGIEARRVEFKWRQQGLPVHQLQLIFLHQDEQGDPLLMQITVTSNHPGGMTPRERSAFYSVIETLELRYTPLAGEAMEQV